MSRQRLSPVVAWFRSSRRMLAAELSQGGWLNFGPFRWSDINIPRALRAGAGMITPLALGLATGHLEYGIFATLGALPAGFVSFQGASRTRVTAVTFAAFGMAVATFVGGVAAYTSGWLLFPAVLIFSYLAGLMAALGQRFLVVGLQWAVQLVIASAIPLPPREAAVRALLVLAGGLWQGALVVVSWAFTRGNQERASLAAAYRALGDYAADVCRRPASSDPSPPPAVFGSDAVDDPNPLLRAQKRYRFLLHARAGRTHPDEPGGRRELRPRLQRPRTGHRRALRPGGRAGGTARSSRTGGRTAGATQGDRTAPGRGVALGRRRAARGDPRRGPDSAAAGPAGHRADPRSQPPPRPARRPRSWLASRLAS